MSSQQPAAPDEQAFRESYMMLETAKAQLEALLKQQDLIQLAVEEHVRARETIKAMSKGSPGDEVLVPLGADSYVHARISDNRDAIVGIGSQVSVMKSNEDAEKVLDLRIDDLSRAFKSVSERAQQTEQAIQELTEKLQDMQQRAAGP